MKSFQRIGLCFLGLCVLIAGCAEDDPEVPPVMSVMDELEGLSKQAEAERMAKIRAEAAENSSVPTSDALNVSHVPDGIPLEGKYVATFDTSVGVFVISVDRSWAPIGADRFYKMVNDGFYDDARFFRVIPDFMVQWGMAADPAMTSKWGVNINDDPVIKSNTRGYMTFAKTGAPNSRSGQVFINYGDNSRLDSDGFAPFGEVVSGMDVVTRINSEYRELPKQEMIRSQGNGYLKVAFPRLSFIRTARITVDDLAVKEEAATEPKASEPSDGAAVKESAAAAAADDQQDESEDE